MEQREVIKFQSLTVKELSTKEFVQSSQIVTVKYYVEVLKRLMAKIRFIRLEYRDPKSWSLLYDKAPSHNAITVRQFFGSESSLYA